MHDEHRKAQEMIKQAEKFKPQPDKWNKFVVNTYSRPRGLRAGKRQIQFSAAELVSINENRYTKEGIGLKSLEKTGSMICSSERKGFSGSLRPNGNLSMSRHKKS